jgi:hypothetical protein
MSIDRLCSETKPTTFFPYYRPVQESSYDREPGYAERYRDSRFRTGSGSGTDKRERKAIASLLSIAAINKGIWLDAPRPRACASVHTLPFGDDAFSGALCMRLLQHIATPVERTTILRELARVTNGPIVVSFFDAHSLQHVRRRLRPLLGKRRSGRFAVSRHGFRQELADAGLEVVAMQSLLRFVGEQTLVLAQRRPAQS